MLHSINWPYFIVWLPWPFVNFGIGTLTKEFELEIGTGTRTDTTNTIISSFIGSMDTKPSRVVIYDEVTPPTKLRDIWYCGYVTKNNVISPLSPGL